MIENSRVKIIGGASARLGTEGIVTGAISIGKNQGKIQILIEETGKKYWYAPEELEVLSSPALTKIGSRIRITSVPFAIKNIEVGIEGVVVKEPEKVADSIQVKIRLEDDRIITWKEDDLEVIEGDRRADKAELAVAEIVEDTEVRPSESSSLAELENTIRKGLDAFYKVAMALKQIKSNQLYKELGYKSFETYCQERWGWGRTYAFYQVKAAGVIENLSEKTFTPGEQNELQGNLPLPTSEKQIRTLSTYSSALQPVIWEKAVVEAGGGVPTSKIVEKVAKEVVEEMVSSKSEEFSTALTSIETSIEEQDLVSEDVADICIIQAGEESELKGYQGCWCVIETVREFSCDVLVYDRRLELVKPEFLEKLSCGAEQKSRAIALMKRLQEIAKVEVVDRMINAILVELGKRRDFSLSVREERILAFIEGELGIK